MKTAIAPVPPPPVPDAALLAAHADLFPELKDAKVVGAHINAKNDKGQLVCSDRDQIAAHAIAMLTAAHAIAMLTAEADAE